MTRTILMALVILAACGDIDDERTLIDEPRLLALRSSAPVLSPLHSELYLDALLVDERGLARPSVEVRMRACSPWEFLLDPATDCPPDASMPLPGGRLALDELLEAFPAPQVGRAPAPDQAQPSAPCDRQALIEVPVIASTVLNGRELLTAKRIPLYLDASPRQNPRLEEPKVMPQAESVGLDIEVSVTAASVDLFCRDGVEEPEPVRVFAYTNRGELDSPFVDLLANDEGELEPAMLEWTPSGDTRDALLWLVAIDSEGGTDWQELLISI